MTGAALHPPSLDPLALLTTPGVGDDLAPGALVGERWLLLRELGRGSQCLAFEMLDLGAVSTVGADAARLPRAVLKVLRTALAEQPVSVALLAHEAAMLDLVGAVPGVVRCLGRLTVHGRPGLVLARAPGVPLVDLLRLGILPQPMAWGALSALAETLGLLHRSGVVHGDVKPGNVVVDAAGRPTLIDFGAARLTGSPAAEAVAATPAWASPAQAQGRPPEEADDLYALALLTARLIGGAHPFGDQAPLEALRQGKSARPVHHAPRALRHLLAEVLNSQDGAHGVTLADLGALLRRGAP